MTHLLKRITLFAFAIVAFSSVSYSQNELKSESGVETKGTEKKSSDEPAGIKMSDGILYGKDFDPSMTVIEFSDLMNAVLDNDGKTILVKGSVSDVCQAMGCWMIMSEGKNNVRVKTDHNFFLPKDIAGSNAVVIGTFKSTKISEEDAKHYNEESKNPTMKTEDISGTQDAYEIEAIGIKILYPVSESGNE
ncbi:MAG: DUF4920 domain-containing protein [bacterium]